MRPIQVFKIWVISEQFFTYDFEIRRECQPFFINVIAGAERNSLSSLSLSGDGIQLQQFENFKISTDLSPYSAYHRKAGSALSHNTFDCRTHNRKVISNILPKNFHNSRCVNVSPSMLAKLASKWVIIYSIYSLIL